MSETEAQARIAEIVSQLINKTFDPKNAAKLSEESTAYLKEMLATPGLTAKTPEKCADCGGTTDVQEMHTMDGRPFFACVVCREPKEYD